MMNLQRHTQPRGGCNSSYSACRRSPFGVRLPQRRSRTVLSSTASGATGLTKAPAPVVRNNIQVGVLRLACPCRWPHRSAAQRGQQTASGCWQRLRLHPGMQLRSWLSRLGTPIAYQLSSAACPLQQRPAFQPGCSTSRAAAPLLDPPGPGSTPFHSPSLFSCLQWAEVTVAGPPGPATRFMIPDPLVYEAVMVRPG